MDVSAALADRENAVSRAIARPIEKLAAVS
jgi:hypothetical protein